jgi:hypothetical protein
LPVKLGKRLQELFCLGDTPKTLGRLAELVEERNSKSLRNPGCSAQFSSVYQGSGIFGGVSYKTRHIVRLADGRQAFAACALDAMIEGFFQPVEIESACLHCEEPVRLKISRGTLERVKPSSVRLWLGASQRQAALTATKTCSCETDACPFINFFSSPEHIADWKERNPNELGMALTLQQSLKLAKKGWYEPIRQAYSGKKN